MTAGGLSTATVAAALTREWGGGVFGPLLYDLASVEMYVGGPRSSGPLVEAYLSTGALHANEVQRALRPLARLR